MEVYEGKYKELRLKGFEFDFFVNTQGTVYLSL